MGKKELDKERHYKNIINKQKHIIQELKKKIGRAGKVKDRYDDLELELSAQIDEIESKEFTKEIDDKLKCPDCLKGDMEFVDLKVRKMWVCPKCNYLQIKK